MFNSKVSINHMSVEEPNIIVMRHLNHPSCVSRFLLSMRTILKRGIKEVVLRCKADQVFPNACVPICGIIQFYINQGIHFSFDYEDTHYLTKCAFKQPIDEEAETIKQQGYNPFDRIYIFRKSDQISWFTQAIVDWLSHNTECEQGILDGLIWCINEAMDNVLLHSESEVGYVMAQFHQSTRHIAICVYDSGVGIYNSLSKSTHIVKTELDSLTLAIQEGVGDGNGQGNGLFGLYQIVNQNQGRLTLTSGKASIMVRSTGDMQKYSSLPILSKHNRGTTVDFQLDINRKVNLQDAFKTIGGYEQFDIRIDNMLSDEDEYIHYNVYENTEGTATRDAGEHIRNDVLNTLKRENRVMILDFAQVKIASSSFLDEFVAKLFLALGFVRFNSRIRIENQNETVRFLCERSLYMRIHDTWRDGQIVSQ